MTIQTHTCSRCKAEKDLTAENFRPDKRIKRGFKARCRACDYEVKQKREADRPADEWHEDREARNARRREAYAAARAKETEEQRKARRENRNLRAKLPRWLRTRDRLSFIRTFISDNTRSQTWAEFYSTLSEVLKIKYKSHLLCPEYRAWAAVENYKAAYSAWFEFPCDAEPERPSDETFELAEVCASVRHDLYTDLTYKLLEDANDLITTKYLGSMHTLQTELDELQGYIDRHSPEDIEFARAYVPKEYSRADFASLSPQERDEIEDYLDAQITAQEEREAALTDEDREARRLERLRQEVEHDVFTFHFGATHEIEGEDELDARHRARSERRVACAAYDQHLQGNDEEVLRFIREAEAKVHAMKYGNCGESND